MSDMSAAVATAPVSAPNTNPAQASAKAPGQDPKQAPAGENAAGQSGEPKLGDLGAAAVKKFKLKVDGHEHEVDEAEVVRRAQMSTAAAKRFEEAEKATRQAQEFIQKLRTNPFEVIDDPRLGLTQEQKVEMVENWYRTQVIEPSTLTPEQRQIKERDAKIKAYEDKEKSAAEAQRQQQMEQLKQHHAQNFQKQILEGLSAEGVPKTEKTAIRMAELMEKNIKLGLELTPAQLATIVREDYIAEQNAMFANADENTILKLMHPDVVNKIRKADLQQLRAGTPQLPKNPIDVAKADAGHDKPKTQWKSLDEERAERERRVAALSQTWGKK